MDDMGNENAKVFVEFWAIFWLEGGGQPNARDHGREQKSGGSGSAFVCGYVGLNPSKECTD